MNQRVFAESPSLARQQSTDSNGVVDIIPSNQTQSESDKNRTLTYTNQSNPQSYNSVDIGDFSYFSDGEVLNATLSFPSPINLSALNSSNATLKYGMLINADDDPKTGYRGADYKIEIIYYKNGSWTKTFQETLGELPVRDTEHYSSSPLFDQKRYVKLSTDLQKMGFPNPYKAVFFAERIDGSIWYIDFTPWVRIPPPEVSISVSPNPLPLTKGEPKSVQLNLKSVPGFSQPTINLTLDNREREEISITECDCTNVNLTSSGEGTVNSRVEVKQDAEVEPYKIDITANVKIPSEPLDFGIFNDSITLGEYDVPAEQRQVYSSLVVDVIPIDYSKYLGTILTIFGIIGGIVTLLGFIFSKDNIFLGLLKKKFKDLLK